MSDLAGLLAIAANDSATEIRLSPNSVAVLLYALGKLYEPGVWADYHGENIPQADIETIHDLVDEASYEVMHPIVTTPVGATMIWHTDTPPSRWLICDGSGYSKTGYPALFALWGTKYGGSVDFFGSPDMRSKLPYGADFLVPLDAAYGAATHTLLEAEMPVHTHTLTDPGHFHDHIRAGGTGTGYTNITGATAINPVNVAWPTQSKLTGITIGNKGSGTAHNNMPPVRGVNFIVYAGEP